MAYRDKLKVEHNGPKRGQGAWDTKAEAKRMARKLRRAQAKGLIRRYGQEGY